MVSHKDVFTKQSRGSKGPKKTKPTPNGPDSLSFGENLPEEGEEEEDGLRLDGTLTLFLLPQAGDSETKIDTINRRDRNDMVQISRFAPCKGQSNFHSSCNHNAI